MLNEIVSPVYKIGDFSVTRVTETVFDKLPSAKLLRDLDPAVFQEQRNWLIPHSYDESNGFLYSSIHTWILETGEHTILVDTGIGNDKQRTFAPIFHQLHEPYLERLAAAGFVPEDVDYVFMTHIHADHAGWNTKLVDGRWEPTFPNAKYVCSKAENDYYVSPESHIDHNKTTHQVYEDSIKPVIDAGKAEMIGPGEFLHGVSFLQTPGHSIDHMSISLKSAGQEALFGGDVMHHPLQVYRPQSNSVYCQFTEQAQATRLRTLNYLADSGAMYFSTHFPESSAGFVSRQADTFIWRYT